jgi:hypothetical protein
VATVNAIIAVIAKVLILIIVIVIVLLGSFVAQINSVVLSYVKYQDAPNVA